MNEEPGPEKYQGFFGQLNLSEEYRLKLAELAQLGQASQAPKWEATFISAGSDTLPLPRKEQENA